MGIIKSIVRVHLAFASIGFLVFGAGELAMGEGELGFWFLVFAALCLLAWRPWKH